MKKFNCLFLLAFSSVFAIAQSNSNMIEVSRVFFQNPDYLLTQNYAGLTGGEMDKENTYFIFDNWEKANIHSNEKEVITVDSLNFHILADKMFFRKNGKLFFLYPKLVQKIEAKNSVFKPFKTGKTQSFYEVIADGEIQLLKKYEIIKEKIHTNPLGISDGSQNYEEKRKASLFYYKTSTNRLERLPRKKKDLIKIFPGHRNQLIQHIRENNLSNKSNADLKRLFSFYNQQVAKKS